MSDVIYKHNKVTWGCWAENSRDGLEGGDRFQVGNLLAPGWDHSQRRKTDAGPPRLGMNWKQFIMEIQNDESNPELKSKF